MGGGMGLTDEEAGRIRRAYESASNAAFERMALDKARGERGALRALMRVWDKMDVEERAAVSFELARLASGDDDAELAVDPHDLDVGLAAHRAVEAGKTKGGNRHRDLGFNLAVAEAVAVWRDRGNDAPKVNVWRDQADNREPGPFLAFIAEAVTAVMSPEAVARATGMRRPDREKLLQTIEARLRT